MERVAKLHKPARNAHLMEFHELPCKRDTHTSRAASLSREILVSPREISCSLTNQETMNTAIYENVIAPWINIVNEQCFTAVVCKFGLDNRR